VTSGSGRRDGAIRWNTVLYEPALAPRDRLCRYTQEFEAVELNASFYRWPLQQTFRGWRHRYPRDSGCA
jgi:uncharacterized protein YecE (DUF72 family)